MNVKIISAILVLSLAVMACGFHVDLSEKTKSESEVKESITVPVPRSGETRLTISFGAGSLKLSPGADGLVEGTAVYNVSDLKPEIVNDGGVIEIKQTSLLNLVNPKDIKNEWALKLGASPMDLTINAGAYRGDFELGGLKLKSLTVRDGASDVDLTFSKPNLTRMDILRYETGASNVTLGRLANANFSTLIFTGGAGDYRLDFSGGLMDNGTVDIEAGAGNMHLVIPKGVSANVTVESTIVSVNASSNWEQNGNIYSQTGYGPTLTIIVGMTAGNLTITD